MTFSTQLRDRSSDLDGDYIGDPAGLPYGNSQEKAKSHGDP